MTRLPLFLGFVLLTPLAAMAADTFENGDFGDCVVFPDSEGNHVEVHHGGIIFAEGKYWWYGQTFHRVPKGPNVWPATETGVCMYSSNNLFDWKYEGVVLACTPSGELEGPMRFERAKILYNDRTKKFVMWFHYIGKGSGPTLPVGRADAGVATCDKINGNYQWHGYQRPLGPNMTVKDCTLFKDDDGQAYFIFASYSVDRPGDFRMYVARLSGDYLKTAEVHEIADSKRREAPAMIKKNGYYFLITSGVSGFRPNAARCHRAENILGPYTDIGEFCRGPKKEITFNSQSTFILELHDKPGHFIFMGDRWNRENMRYSSHVWLPLEFPANDTIEMHYHRSWDTHFRNIPVQKRKTP